MSKAVDSLDPERHNAVLYRTLDNTNPLGLAPGTPAMTTLLYKVCDQDSEKFNEAIRLINLFLDVKDTLNEKA